MDTTTTKKKCGRRPMAAGGQRLSTYVYRAHMTGIALVMKRYKLTRQSAVRKVLDAGLKATLGDDVVLKGEAATPGAES